MHFFLGKPWPMIAWALINLKQVRIDQSKHIEVAHSVWGCYILFQGCGRNWIFCTFSSFNQQSSAKHQNIFRRRPSHNIWFWIPFAPITFSFTTLVPKKRQLFELKMQFIISFKFYLFCRIGTIAIVHQLVLEFQTLK